MSHLEHIFVSINGSWTDKISPPVILPISLVKVEEHITLFRDEKGRQRDSSWEWNTKGSMSSARTESCDLREPAQSSARDCLRAGILCLLLLIIYFPFSINFHGIRCWFDQGRHLWSTFEGELESSSILFLSRCTDSGRLPLLYRNTQHTKMRKRALHIFNVSFKNTS